MTSARRCSRCEALTRTGGLCPACRDKEFPGVELPDARDVELARLAASLTPCRACFARAFDGRECLACGHRRAGWEPDEDDAL